MFSYCAYQGCPNKNVPCSVLTFFQLPKDERRNVWIKNSGNPELKSLSDKTIKYFCDQHFDPKYVRRQFSRATLHKSAVPYKYNGDQTLDNSTSIINNTNKDDNVEYFLSDNDVSSNNSNEIQCNIDTERYEYFIDSETDEQNSTSPTINENEDNNYILFDDVDLKSEKYEIKEIRSRNHLKRKADEDNSKSNHNDNYRKQSNNSNEYANRNKVCNDVEDDDDDDQRGGSKNEIDEKNEVDNIEYLSDNKDSCIYVISKDKMHVKTDENKVKGKKRSDEVKQYSNLPHSSRNSIENQEILSSNNEYEEDKHFALSLVGYFQRLTHQKKAVAKLKILQYLTDLEFNGKGNL